MHCLKKATGTCFCCCRYCLLVSQGRNAILIISYLPRMLFIYLPQTLVIKTCETSTQCIPSGKVWHPWNCSGLRENAALLIPLIDPLFSRRSQNGKRFLPVSCPADCWSQSLARRTDSHTCTLSWSPGTHKWTVSLQHALQLSTNPDWSTIFISTHTRAWVTGKFTQSCKKQELYDVFGTEHLSGKKTTTTKHANKSARSYDTLVLV